MGRCPLTSRLSPLPRHPQYLDSALLELDCLVQRHSDVAVLEACARAYGAYCHEGGFAQCHAGPAWSRLVDMLVDALTPLLDVFIQHEVPALGVLCGWCEWCRCVGVVSGVCASVLCGCGRCVGVVCVVRVGGVGVVWCGRVGVVWYGRVGVVWVVWVRGCGVGDVGACGHGAGAWVWCGMSGVDVWVCCGWHVVMVWVRGCGV